MHTIRERLNSVVSQQMGVEESSLKESTSLIELGMDSLDSQELIYEIEEEFDFSFGDSILNVETFGDLLSIVEKNKK